MGSIATYYHPYRYWIKAKGPCLVRVCVGEKDDYGLPSPIFINMTHAEFEADTGRKVEDEPVCEQ